MIDNLKTKKVCQNKDILAKVIKLNKDIAAPFISENVNSCIEKGEFHNDLKHADIVPMYK